MNDEIVKINSLAANRALAQAIAAIAESTDTSKQQAEILREDIKAHLHCAQHHISALFAELNK